MTASDKMILGNNAVNVGIGLSGITPGPGNNLEINATANNASGLRFRKLTSSVAPSTAVTTNVLSVNAAGDVILIPGSGGIVGACSAVPTLTSDAGTNLNGNNFYFGGAATANNKNSVGIGLSCGNTMSGRLHVFSNQNFAGTSTGIYSDVSNSLSAANGNYGIQAKAGRGQFNYAVLASAIDPSSGTAGLNVGVWGSAAAAPTNYGGLFSTTNTSLAAINYGVYGSTPTIPNGANPNWWAGYFQGKVTITGMLTKGGGTFKIDHPQDPANRYLSHSFVESPDMMNIYNGNTTTDQNGEATVQLPTYFEALNFDFRYQLTCIGTFAQAIISEKVQGNQFKIRTDKPGVEVSWQVTGVRQDAWANANRIVPETDKTGYEKGKYLHPELFGQPAEMSVDPMMAKRNGQQPEAASGVIRQ